MVNILRPRQKGPYQQLSKGWGLAKVKNPAPRILRYKWFRRELGPRHPVPPPSLPPTPTPSSVNDVSS